MKSLALRLIAIGLVTVAHDSFAQVGFTLRNDLLFEKDAHSAVPVGITDMNGDGLDDIVTFNYGRRLVVQYQTPDINRPFIRYESEIVLDNNEQNDIIIG